MTVPDESLISFIEGAKSFLRNEVDIPITDEQAKYLIVYHFESFSSAYLRYREKPNELTRYLLCIVVEHAALLHMRHYSYREHSA